MGTDLALDLAPRCLGRAEIRCLDRQLFAYDPAERLAGRHSDDPLGGGLYGLNPVCKASLSQARRAVLGAARAVEPPSRDRPQIGMTSFGKTVLRYMVGLKPALEARGYDLAVFPCHGHGRAGLRGAGRAGGLCRGDGLCAAEVGNHLFGSAISAGPDRMTAAGRKGVPQIVSIGCYDLVDLVGWHPIPPRLADRPAMPITAC